MQRLRTENGEERKTSAGAVLSPASETVSVPKHTEEHVRHQSNLPMIVVPFFLIISLAIGSVFFMHGYRVKRQKELYAAYLAQNKWLLPIKAAYPPIRAELIHLESIDPAKKQDWKQAGRDLAKLKVDLKVLQPPAVSQSVDGGIVLSNDLKYLEEDYSTNLYQLWLPTGLHTNKDARDEAVRLLAERLQGNYRPKVMPIKNDEFAAAEKAALQKATADISSWDNEKLSKRLFEILDTRNLYYQMKFRREQFEQDMKNAEEVPPGLDLEKAKALR